VHCCSDITHNYATHTPKPRGPSEKYKLHTVELVYPNSISSSLAGPALAPPGTADLRRWRRLKRRRVTTRHVDMRVVSAATRG
jgi:hypothetical protein